MPSVVVRGAVLVAALAWAAFAFWLFSFSFSDGFFRYNLASRLPPFLCAFAAALFIPWSGVRQWRDGSTHCPWAGNAQMSSTTAPLRSRRCINRVLRPKVLPLLP